LTEIDRQDRIEAMVQKKMRPMFSRGHSVASFSVARDGAGKQDDEPGAAAAEPQSQEGVGGSAAAASAAASAPLSPQQLRRRRRRQLAARLRVSFAEPSVVTARHPAGEPLTDKELRAYFYSVRVLVLLLVLCRCLPTSSRLESFIELSLMSPCSSLFSAQRTFAENLNVSSIPPRRRTT
jgi:hypothetical protein